MKLKLFVALLFMVLGMQNIQAETPQAPKCNNKSTCVDDKNFYVEVKRVARRGDVIVVQLIYKGKTSRQHYFKFTHNAFEGYATILDAQGNEFSVKGKNISNFYLTNGEEKVISLKFRGDEKKKIVEPFDLTLKTYSDEITLFDLKP